MVSLIRTVGSSLMAVLLAGGLFSPASAQVDSAADAKRIVKAMSDYMASQSNLSGEFDAELDVITPDVEKIQFSASGSLLLERPGKIRLIRKGGYTEVELLSDGKTMTIIDLGSGAYFQVSSPGTSMA